ncbi:guanosine-3',5'-bis(diphosphate) 3'-pyrophosphohydrolase [Riemerella columbina]|uniref:guanosine-3',5'-bis(diphosphate) 3'-pyrophosphohydrolase n=1 Tax=Riemerella columbina TaxID=103810 RepID=UPI0003745C34|nr:guanosine-3',5'-bis(diphosphate) 3'-pyrophosphohydrolase [Riemerella columbina]
MLERAIQIAVNAHKGQTDKAGKPYILHLVRVMEKGKTEEEKICGILHDLLEDTNWTISDLRKEGFSEEIMNALQCVTKKNNEPYSDFINRISKNPLAIRVKLNDLEDNMDKSRLNNINEKDLQRFEKYSMAYEFLKNKLGKDL